MTTARQIGIAGLGLLGSALAHRLIGAGFDPKGYDIDAAKIAAFAKAGGIAASARRGRALRRRAARGVRHRPGRGRGGECAAAGADAGQAKIVLCASTCDPDRIAALTGKAAPHSH